VHQEEVIKALQELSYAGLRDSARALTDSHLVTARAEGDSSFLLQLLTLEGAVRAGMGQARSGEPLLREAISLAEALSDSQTLCVALRWLSVSVEAQGGSSEALDLYKRLLTISRSIGDLDNEGWARVGLGWDATKRGRGDVAVAEYRRASELFASAGDKQGEVWALNGLAKSLYNLGAFDEARECYVRAAAQVDEEIGPEAVRAYMLNNILNDLGNLEFYLGDPGKAQEHYRQASELIRGTGNVRGWITPALNVVVCQTHMGQYDDAIEGLEILREHCEQGNYMDILADVLTQLAEVRRLQGRNHESAAYFRRAFGLGEALPLEDRVHALVLFSEVLAAMDSTDKALSVLEEGSRWLGGSSEAHPRLSVASHKADMLYELGRYDEALRELLYAEQGERQLGLFGVRVSTLARTARCCRALGLRDSALAFLEEAASVWESNRAVPLDPEWRERRGKHSRWVATDLAAMLLDHPLDTPPPERMRHAYDRLQIFKARTLLERMAGPGEALEALYEIGVPEPATLEKLQNEVLEADELLLDAFLGPEQSLLFAITREECRVARLPSDIALTEKLHLFYRLLSRPPEDATVDEDLLSQIGEGISKQLLGEFPDMIARCERILVAPDGAMNLLPLGALPFPSAEDNHPGGKLDALVARKELARIPSATFLAWHRGRDSRPGAGITPRILAAASDRTDLGEALPGAVREVRHLAGRYNGVDRIIVSGDSCSIPIPDTLGSYDVLHFAAHARVDDQHPWRSMIRFCRDNESHNPRADRIASMQLPARLAVLSSCQSAGGRILSGEGVQGLSSAFLSTGVPAVMATLWAVDDRATAELMEQFYEELARGETAAAALRAAQISLSEDSRTQHPYFWAGFVLVGDGEVRVDLTRRRNVLPYFALGILAFVLALGYRLIRPKTKTPRAA
jgi:tetratricopeptide (TPR) repeat protein